MVSGPCKFFVMFVDQGAALLKMFLCKSKSRADCNTDTRIPEPGSPLSLDLRYCIFIRRFQNTSSWWPQNRQLLTPR
jgi:hypothetical protein